MRAYVNGNIFTGHEILRHHGILTRDGTILDVLEGKSVPPHSDIIDLQGNLLVPAFIDLQIYGGNGRLFGEFPSVEALKATQAYCLAGGATLFLPTVATNSEAVMFAAIDAVRAYWNQGGRGVLGLHLEGPFIHPAKRGAHLPEFILPPTLENVKKTLSYGEGVIKMMTFAPELCSGELLDFLLRQNIVLSAGHSNATYEQGMAAFNKGIKTATHLFNAMSALQHRAPGLAGAILDHPAVNVSIVADGHHVDFPVIRISKKVLGERLFLITDAVTESPNGRYTHRRQGDKFVLADGTLSGSALTMAQAVKNCVNRAGIPLEEALRMASLYPARVLGLDQVFGQIEAGFVASFVVLNQNGDLVSVFEPS